MCVLYAHIGTESTTEGLQARTYDTRPIRFQQSSQQPNLIGLEVLVQACSPSVVLSVPMWFTLSSFCLNIRGSLLPERKTFLAVDTTFPGDAVIWKTSCFRINITEIEFAMKIYRMIKEIRKMIKNDFPFVHFLSIIILEISNQVTNLPRKWCSVNAFSFIYRVLGSWGPKVITFFS